MTLHWADPKLPPDPNPTPIPGPIKLAFSMYSDVPTHVHCTYVIDPGNAVWFKAATGPTKTLQKEGDVGLNPKLYTLNAGLVWADGTPPEGTFVISGLVVDATGQNHLTVTWSVAPAGGPKLTAARALFR